jgi:hypothetical protein
MSTYDAIEAIKHTQDINKHILKRQCQMTRWYDTQLPRWNPKLVPRVIPRIKVIGDIMTM